METQAPSHWEGAFFVFTFQKYACAISSNHSTDAVVLLPPGSAFGKQ